MRICLYAGPGAGKSAVASKIFAELKSQHHKVELVNEYIKTWAYRGIKPVSFDQLYIFAKQLHAEDLWLRHVDHIVTDSPLAMQCAYIERYGSAFLNETLNICKKFEESYPSFNIFLSRDGVPYQETGRYENIKEAVAMDEQIKAFLAQNKISYVEIRTVDFADIMMAINTVVGVG